MTNDKSYARWLTIAIVLAFILRLGWIFALKTYRFDDTWDAGWEMGRLARNIAERQGLSLSGGDFLATDHLTPTAWFGPVYPYYLSIFFKLFGPYTIKALIAAQVAGAFIAALSILPLASIAASLFGRPVALVTAMLWAVSPHAILWATHLWLANFFAAVLLCWIWSVIRCRDAQTPAWAIAAGLLTGLAVLTDGIASAVAVVVGLWLLFSGGAPFKKRFTTTAIVTGVAVLCAVPWTVRNYHVFGRFIPMRSALGLNLYIGNNPDSDGNYKKAMPMIAAQTTEAEHAYLATLNEYELSQFLGARARHWIAQHPGDFAKLTLKRAVYFWFQELRGPEWKKVRWWAKFIIGVPMVALAFIGFLVSAAKHGVTLVHWVTFFYPVGYYVTHSGIPRYRHPMMPFILLFVSILLVMPWTAYRRAQDKQPVSAQYSR